jgi:hypothetical protein
MLPRSSQGCTSTTLHRCLSTLCFLIHARHLPYLTLTLSEINSGIATFEYPEATAGSRLPLPWLPWYPQLHCACARLLPLSAFARKRESTQRLAWRRFSADAILRAWSYSTYSIDQIDHTRTAQSGGGSFQDRKCIGVVSCCDSWMAERTNGPKDGWGSVSLSLYLSLFLSICVALSIYPSIHLSI